MEIIKTVNITKKFDNFIANQDINLSIQSGEIKAIVGENGAGKTTLMNIMYGLLKPTSGEIYIKGNKVDINSPTDAIKFGIGMVHQHFKLVPSLTVYENVLLGIEINKSFLAKKKHIHYPILDKKEEMRLVQSIIDSYHFDLKADDLLKDLSIGAKQKVEIVKMLYRDVDILIFDEPTAVLTPQEIEAFFMTLREMKKEGKTILIITHKLAEVMEISDSVTVIKQGKIIGNLLTKDTSASHLAQLMVGRDVLLKIDKNYTNTNSNPVVYEVKNLSTINADGLQVVKDVSFQIKEGEIVGIAGVEGNGQSELLQLLSGLMCSTSGTVFLNETNITNNWPKELRKKGIGIIPEDRYIHGLCKEMKITDNLIAGYLDDSSICVHGILSKNKISKKCIGLIQKYDIRLSDMEGLVSSLSGGNAQKIIISREFDSNPTVLIAAQPTRGVDIGAIEFIHNSLISLQKKNKAILLISSELSEIMNLSDRILVMYKGEIIGEVQGKNALREDIGLLMAGIRRKDDQTNASKP
ncbi:MAG: ABC transporter ATP-binding protein [Lachnospiraceae bacterium]|jgi:simple sugar transport system ATP-binding protein|nr:ABC transporter ATP-binding protein [Lachnospiraceae bacterium]